jgi:hypothetical protein
LFPEVNLLREHVESWAISDPVPVGVADYLRIARELLLQSYFLYKFALVATMWTMLALEAPLLGLVDQFLVDDEGASALHDVRSLRNQISHHAVGFTVPPGTVLQWVGALQEAVSDIYTRALRSPEWAS